MSCSRDEIEELIDDLIDSFDDYKAYYERSDFVQWSEEAEAGAMEKYHGIRNKIIELCVDDEDEFASGADADPYSTQYREGPMPRFNVNGRICNCGWCKHRMVSVLKEPCSQCLRQNFETKEFFVQRYDEVPEFVAEVDEYGYLRCHDDN